MLECFQRNIVVIDAFSYYRSLFVVWYIFYLLLYAGYPVGHQITPYFRVSWFKLRRSWHEKTNDMDDNDGNMGSVKSYEGEFSLFVPRLTLAFLLPFDLALTSPSLSDSKPPRLRFLVLLHPFICSAFSSYLYFHLFWLFFSRIRRIVYSSHISCFVCPPEHFSH